ncbi:MAG: hypothetical protein WBA10_11970 [Elainellaceae cyanobacterium]
MVSSQCDRNSSALWIGLLCSTLGHIVLVLWLGEADFYAGQAAADQPNQVTPIQLIELPTDSAESVTAPAAAAPRPAAAATPSPESVDGFASGSVSIRGDSFSTEPSPPTPIIEAPSPEAIARSTQATTAPSDLPVDDTPTERPNEPPANPETLAPETPTPDAPSVPTIADEDLIPLDSPPVNASPSDALTNEDVLPPGNVPFDERPTPTALPTVTLPGQPVPATYRVAITSISPFSHNSVNGFDQLPYALETERIFDADPQASPCLPDPESARRLGETVAIRVRVKMTGDVVPLSVVLLPADSSPNSSTAPMGESPIQEAASYDQLAACLLGEWEFQPALEAGGSPVDSDDLVVSVQIVSLP